MPNAEITMKYGDISLNFLPASGYLENSAIEFVRAVSSPIFRPTAWGIDPPREVFVDAAFQNDVNKGDYLRNCFVRTLAPKWSGFYSTEMIRFEFMQPLAKKWWSQLFDWASQIAAVCKPEFGVCHPFLISEDCIQNNWSALVGYENIHKYGPPWFGARTYLGKRLLKAIGLQNIQSSGVDRVLEIDSGVQIDLIDSPWDATVEELYERQTSVLTSLLKTGVFGDYGLTSIDVKAGPKWKKSTIRLP